MCPLLLADRRSDAAVGHNAKVTLFDGELEVDERLDEAAVAVGKTRRIMFGCVETYSGA